MVKRNDNKIWTFAIILVTIIIAVQIINMRFDQTSNGKKENKLSNVAQVTQISDTIISGNAAFTDTGVARLCINTEPIIIYDCNLTDFIFNTSTPYSCKMNATDPNGDSVTFYSEWLTSNEMFNITSDGYIIFNPPKAAMGQTNIVRINVSDSSGCSNNNTFAEYSVSVTGENRPPYLSRNMSSQELVKDKYYLFRLNDFFTDPDGDPLSYFSIMTTGGTVRIGITGSQVVIKGLSCGISTVYYVASDPYGLTAQSNTVSYNVVCPNVTQTEISSSQSGGGGGGGGGTQEVCTPNWKCSAWSACQMGNFTYRRCIDRNGCDIKNYDHYMF